MNNHTVRLFKLFGLAITPPDEAQPSYETAKALSALPGLQ
jgi:hypothetical protein